MRLTPEQEAEIRAAREVRHETRRPTVPALEEILFEALPVLDHGFVRVIDYMGDDAAIVQAARVSYGKGTKKVNEDRGLIRYLVRHRHSTPQEMCEIKLHCKLPIFVARQWIRHRTACLAGDTQVSFDMPGAERRGRRHHHAMSIERLHRSWHRGAAPIALAEKKPHFLDRVRPDVRYTIPELADLVERRQEDLRNAARDGRLAAERGDGRVYVQGSAWHAWARWSRRIRMPMRDRVAAMHVRICEEPTGCITHSRVVDVWETGVRPVLRVVLANGQALEMTKDHRCLTEAGWLTLQRALSLRVAPDGRVHWNARAPGLAVSSASGRLGRDYSRVVEIESTGMRRTFDLEVEGPFHNFVANGFIVHNSVNEYSARYSILDREFYVPAPVDLGVQATANRQGRGEVLPDDRAVDVLRMLREDAERCYDHYQDMLNLDDEGKEIRPGEPGLARELARMNLTLAYYTQWYWKIDLHNLLHFLSLRLDDHAQEEIRAYARAIAEITKRWVPHAWEAFVDYRLEGMHLSRAERDAIRKMLAGEKPDLAALGMSKREQEEFRKKFE